MFTVHIVNEDHVVVFGFTRTLQERVRAGEVVSLRGEIENMLVPGRYTIDCWIRRDREMGDMGLQAMRLIHFVVYGTAPRHGVVSLRTDIEPALEPSE